MTDIYMVMKPCCCDMLSEPHAHAPGGDLVPWSTMRESFLNAPQKETDAPFIVEEDCIKYKIASIKEPLQIVPAVAQNGDITTIDWQMNFPYPFSCSVPKVIDDYTSKTDKK